MCYSTTYVYKLDKEFLVPVTKWYHEDKLKRLGIRPVMEFDGNPATLKFHDIFSKYKLLDPNVLFSTNKNDRMGKLYRVSVGIEDKLNAFYRAERRKKHERYKKRVSERIIVEDGMFIEKEKDFNKLACPNCKRVPDVSGLNDPIILTLDGKKYFPESAVEFFDAISKEGRRLNRGDDRFRKYYKLFREEQKRAAKANKNLIRLRYKKLICWRCVGHNNNSEMKMLMPQKGGHRVIYVSKVI